ALASASSRSPPSSNSYIRAGKPPKSGISIATVQRLEARGKLDKVRLAGSANGAVFHRASQVHALAAGAAEPKNNSPSAAKTVAPDAPEPPKPTPKTKRRTAARDEIVEEAAE